MVTCVTEKNQPEQKKKTMGAKSSGVHSDILIYMPCEEGKTKTRDGDCKEVKDSVDHGPINIFPPTQADGGMKNNGGSTLCMSCLSTCCFCFVCLSYLCLAVCSFTYLFTKRARGDHRRKTNF